MMILVVTRAPYVIGSTRLTNYEHMVSARASSIAEFSFVPIFSPPKSKADEMLTFRCFGGWDAQTSYLLVAWMTSSYVEGG